MKSCREQIATLIVFWFKESIDVKQHRENMKLIGTRKNFNVERLREPSTIIYYQKQLGKEFEKTVKERAVEELIHIDEVQKQIKEAVDAKEQTVGY
jgi:hypothetical protein